MSELASALEVEDVHKHFARGAERIDILRGVSFVLEAGQSLAITGPSGSGKSTLLHALGTLDAPSSGRIRIEGADPYVLPEPELARFRNRHVGFVFQNHHLLPQYSVLENVLLPTLAFPPVSDTVAARARDLLERIGLAQRMQHRPAELSGGECQRVAVARALIHSPRLLLCDEPTGSLDQRTAHAVADLLFDLHRAEETVLVAVTHDAQLAARFARRFALEEGLCVEV